MDQLDIVVPVRFEGGIIRRPDGLEDARQREKPTGVQPFGKIIVVRKMTESPGLDLPDDHLELIEVPGSRDLLPAVGILDDKVTESEFPLHIIFQFLGQDLGALVKESDAQFPGNLTHVFLRGLHQEGHSGIVRTDHLAKVHARIRLFIGTFVPFLQDKAYIGDHSQQVVLVLLV